MARRGQAGRGMVRHGRHGGVWFGKARPGEARQARHGAAWHGQARRGGVWQAWRGTARLGLVGLGRARLGEHGAGGEQSSPASFHEWLHPVEIIVAEVIDVVFDNDVSCRLLDFDQHDP